MCLILLYLLILFLDELNGNFYMILDLSLVFYILILHLSTNLSNAISVEDPDSCGYKKAEELVIIEYIKSYYA